MRSPYELNYESSPKSKLNKELPLLFDFIEANWHIDNLKIFGLSSQGFKLDNEEAKERYRNEGPEKFGYLIKPDESETRDITLLISEIL